MQTTDPKDLFFDLINRSTYDYYFTITFKEHDHKGHDLNLNEDHQIKKFLTKLHKKLFCQSFKKRNLFLDILLVRETNISKPNDHFHGLISSSHTITFKRLIKAFQYASNKLYSTTGIYDWEIPELTFNQFKNNYTVDPYDYAPNNYTPELLNILPRELIDKLLINSEDHSFPHNLVPIESLEDQQNITNYILKDTWKNTDHIAFLKPELKDEYFNFTTKAE